MGPIAATRGIAVAASENPVLDGSSCKPSRIPTERRRPAPDSRLKAIAGSRVPVAIMPAGLRPLEQGHRRLDAIYGMVPLLYGSVAPPAFLSLHFVF